MYKEGYVYIYIYTLLYIQRERVSSLITGNQMQKKYKIKWKLGL